LARGGRRPPRPMALTARGVPRRRVGVSPVRAT
jgi:hypothetical protein